VPPFFADRHRAGDAVLWPNTIGLERKGFSAERIKALQKAFRVLTRSKKNTSQALAEIRKSMANSADVKELVEFVEKAERRIVK